MFQVVAPFFLLASGMTASKCLLQTCDPFFLVGIRALIGGLILVSISYFYSPKEFLARAWKHWKTVALLALFATFIPALLKAYALKYAISSKISLIGSLDPFITALYMFVLYKEKLTPLKWLGIAWGFTGSLILIFGNSGMDELSLLGALSWAEFAALAHVCISRLGWIQLQQLLKAHIFSSREINGLCMLIAGIYCVVTTIIFRPHAFSSVTWDMHTMGLLAYIIVAANLLGYTLYSQLLKKHSSTFVALAGFLTPLFVYFLGWLILCEPLYPNFLISGTVTFTGLLIFYQQELRQFLRTTK